MAEGAEGVRSGRDDEVRGNLGDPHHQGQHGRRQDADDQRPTDLQHPQRDREREARPEDKLRGLSREDRNHRRNAALGRDDGTAIDEPDEQDEEADADADRALQGEGHCIHDRFPGADHDKDSDRDPFEDDHAHRPWERQALPEDEREGNDGVDAEAGGKGERVVRKDAHGDRHDPGDESGAGGSRNRVEARRRQNLRVQEDDVRHHHEGGDARANLRS